MGKHVFIAEKPSVAKEFAKVLGVNGKGTDGYLENENYIVTWCVGHLVTMSYPEVYDPNLKKWSMSTLPFIPETYKYEVSGNVAKQFKIVSGILNRSDVDRIYVCTDAGREGEYIYRLVEQEAHVTGKDRRRVWIDSQTEDEIKRGIAEAKDLSEYDNLSASAYLRAKEDYLMGINFSRLLSLKYGNSMAAYLNEKYVSIAVGRVMTCVLGMVVKREREIRNFDKTPFYGISASIISGDNGSVKFDGEWRAVEGSKYFESPRLYKENGFKTREDAENLVSELNAISNPLMVSVFSIEKKKETKNPPLLFNLAELQNTCSKFFKISPDQTLNIVQELYEKKLVTYPRTDARVLSTAVAKEIDKNIRGLLGINSVKDHANYILTNETYKSIAKSKYTNDKQITDHYAIIPTGQGLGNMRGLNPLSLKVYETIVRRFLAIFFPPAIYEKVSLVTEAGNEKFFSNFKVLKEPGYLEVMKYSFFKDISKKTENNDKNASTNGDATEDESGKPEEDEEINDESLLEIVSKLKKGDSLQVEALTIKEGETSPPKRYTSGSMIMAMEGAGKLIEDEDLRAQIKSSGIGTSATRAEIIAKLVRNKYINQNNKTQVLTPTLMGEMITDVVAVSINHLLLPDFTASWEKGLSGVADGTISEAEYMNKLDGFIRRRTDAVKNVNNQNNMRQYYDAAAKFYKKGKATNKQE